jgi:flagellar biosynthesis protein FlhG
VEEVLDVAGKTDEVGRGIAETTLRTFHPALILNRVSGRSRVNVLQLKRLLKEYVGGDLTLLGEIPDDPAMERAVRSYLPVVDNDPSSPAAAALGRVADALMQMLIAPPSQAA